MQNLRTAANRIERTRGHVDQKIVSRARFDLPDRKSASANTQAVDMDQRYVTLTITQGSGKLIVTAPADANTAPSDYYMLIIVNSKGIPSKMRFVQVGS